MSKFGFFFIFQLKKHWFSCFLVNFSLKMSKNWQKCWRKSQQNFRFALQKWPPFFAVTKFLESSEKWECSAQEIARLIIFEGWFFGFFQFLKWWFCKNISFFTNSCPFGSKIWQFFWKIWKSIWKVKCLLRLVTTDPICQNKLVRLLYYTVI